MVIDTRTPCSSCYRRDQRLLACPDCGSRICPFCKELHEQFDHKENKELRQKREPESTEDED